MIKLNLNKYIAIISILFLVIGLGFLCSCGSREDEPLKDKKSDSVNDNDRLIYSGKDDLGRVLGMPGDKDIPNYKSDKLVGVFYFVNHGGKTTMGPYDISKILEKDPEAYKTDEKWINAGGGKVNTIHWWAESLFGYFRGADKWVKQKDVQLLTDAGIDFLVLDTSNGATYKEHVMVLLEALDDYHKQGFNVPKVSFVTKANSGSHMMEIYNQIYLEHPEYSHLWFNLEGKPLILGKTSAPEFTDDFKEFFTIKYAQWPRESIHDDDGFPWMSFERPQHLYGKHSKTSIISVSVAQHTGSLAFSNGTFYGDESLRSRSYHNGIEDKSDDAYLYGYNFAEQFEYAISVNPDIIFITGWNEWIAYRINEWHDVNDNVYKDNAIFVDLASANYSRDIQPMKGGYGDNYYMQMIYYIRKFKGVGVFNNRLTEKKNTYSQIDIKGNFSQWENVGKTYIDYTGDTMHRNERGFGMLKYINDTGRNDFSLLKVSCDNENIYFYAETTDQITSFTDTNWMSLFIGTGNSENNWYGYDYVLNRVSPSETNAKLEKCLGGWSWSQIAEVEYRCEGNKLMVKIPLSVLGLSDNFVSISFKWADNYQGEGDIYSFYTDGDSAPYGRLNYVFNK